jgi:hypothetical protein
VAQVNIHVLHFARVDPLARLGVGLIGQPQVNAACQSEGSVELRAGGSARKNAHLELLPVEVGVRDAARQFDGDCFWIAGLGDPAHADLVAGLNQCGGLGPAHDLALKPGVENTRGGIGAQ